MSEERSVSQDPQTSQTPVPWRGLLATAAAVGHYVWTERRLFEALGAWSVAETDPAIKVGFDAQSHRHAWHAELLIDRLPELRELDVAALVVAPDTEFAAFMDEVAAADSLTDRLVSVHRITVPHLLVAYRRELASLADVAEASLRRSLGFIIADLTEQVASGETLLGSTVVDEGSEERVLQSQQRVERSLLRSVGLHN